MKRSRPGVLATRAVNQYRRREVHSYLGLRYYLANICAREDNWILSVPTADIMTRSHQPYFRTYNFKEVKERNLVEYRSLCLPSPVEALAETALLWQCGANKTSVRPHNNVFSYHLHTGSQREGSFIPFMKGINRRQSVLRKACEDQPDGNICHLDIRKYYPSISSDLAENAWSTFCSASSLAKQWTELGKKLLFDHRQACTSGELAVLTGPMFSHLIGNLVLAKFDQQCSNELKCTYTRYVDDIVLVGDKTNIDRGEVLVRGLLSDLGLEVHARGSEKCLEGTCQQWLSSSLDTEIAELSRCWRDLIASIKVFLLVYPDLVAEMGYAFREAGMRVPLPDYREAVREQGWLSRMQNAVAYFTAFNPSSRSTLIYIIDEAKKIRKRLEQAMEESIVRHGKAAGFDKKFNLSKLRFLSGRLAYLSPNDKLKSYGTALAELDDVVLQGRVLQTISSGNLSHVLGFGGNAVQACSQALRAAHQACFLEVDMMNEQVAQAISIVYLNGLVPEIRSAVEIGDHPNIRFAMSGPSLETFQSEDLYLRELACLHGLSSGPRHQEFLECAFDVESGISFDAIEVFDGSNS